MRIQKRHKIAIFLAIIFLADCSSIGFTEIYIPISGGDWKITSHAVLSNEDGSITERRGSAEITCGETKIEMSEFEVAQFGMVGPPLLPLIPIFNNDKAKLSVAISNVKSSFKCPYLEYEGRTTSAVQSEILAADGSCRYYLEMEDSKQDLNIKIFSGDLACDIPPLKFQRKAAWQYEPFVVPYT